MTTSRTSTAMRTEKRLAARTSSGRQMLDTVYLPLAGRVEPGLARVLAVCLQPGLEVHLALAHECHRVAVGGQRQLVEAAGEQVRGHVGIERHREAAGRARRRGLALLDHLPVGRVDDHVAEPDRA